MYRLATGKRSVCCISHTPIVLANEKPAQSRARLSDICNSAFESTVPRGKMSKHANINKKDFLSSTTNFRINFVVKHLIVYMQSLRLPDNLRFNSSFEQKKQEQFFDLDAILLRTEIIFVPPRVIVLNK